MLAAGSLRHRVRIERFTDTEDGAGGYTRVWNELITVWASATPTGGREGLIAGTLTSSQGWRVQIRFRSGITVKDRMIHNGQVLNIRSIEDPDGRRESLIAFCETGDDG